MIRTKLSIAAVGLRLPRGEDFAYFHQQGFSEDFLRTENTLLTRARNGNICRNADGSPQLECTCGLVLTGRTDPRHPLFTHGGSCWTNDSLPQRKQPAVDDPRHHPRNRCVHLAFYTTKFYRPGHGPADCTGSGPGARWSHHAGQRSQPGEHLPDLRAGGTVWLRQGGLCDHYVLVNRILQSVGP